MATTRRKRIRARREALRVQEARRLAHARARTERLQRFDEPLVAAIACAAIVALLVIAAGLIAS